jgi:acetyltransferase-like isoleucine patch superfamily enzyme
MKFSKAARKLRGKPLPEVLARCFSYGRGYLLSTRFEKRGLISARGSVRIFRKNGMISVGEFTEFWPGVKVSCWGKYKGEPALIRIGTRCSIGDRTEIHAGKSVQIGNDVIIAWDCVIMDRDYHSTFGMGEVFEPVLIGNGVWIGCRAIILKGVTIGEGAVVGAGSVVTKSVDPFMLVAGNPARVIRKVHGWKGETPGLREISSGSV